MGAKQWNRILQWGQIKARILLLPLMAIAELNDSWNQLTETVTYIA